MNNNEMRWDPTVIYIGTHIFLPKKVGKNWWSVKNSLTFMSGDNRFKAFSEGPTHVAIPREYITKEDWPDFKQYPKQYIGPSEFPQVYMNSIYPLYDDQKGAFEAMKNESGIINLACGRGKTVIALHAITSRGCPAFIVVPTVALAYQWKQRILEHTDLDEPEIGWVQGDRSKWNLYRPVTIGILKSVAKAAKESTFDMEAQAFFGTWVFDECHNLSTTEFHHAAGLGFGMRWGLSATPYRKDGNEGLFYANLGPLLYSDTNQPNVANITFLDTGISMPPDVVKSCRIRGELSLAKVCTAVTENGHRLDVIKEILKVLIKKGRTVLVLVERTSVMKFFSKHFIDCGVINGSVKGSARMEELQKNPIIATRSLAKEGLDRKDIDTVLVVYPFTDKGNFIQICGRAQRSKDPKVFFITDKIAPVQGMKKVLQRLSINEGYPHRTINLSEALNDDTKLV